MELVPLGQLDKGFHFPGPAVLEFKLTMKDLKKKKKSAQTLEELEAYEIEELAAKSKILDHDRKLV